LFPWPELARQGIGLWPNRGDDPGEAKVAALLARFGYDPEAPLEKTVTAFQRHFRPTRVDGMADAETRALLAGLIALYDAKKRDAR
jgi:N-acetylmuramoyl-L-alanine amidase